MPHPRQRAYAYEKLLQGKGYWWIVHELVSSDSVTEDEAHAIVTEVWPEAMRVSLQRNRRHVAIGIALCVLPAAIAVASVFLTDRDNSAVTAMATFRVFANPIFLAPMVVGLSLLAYGISGLRRYARTGQNPGCRS